jgi:hypothetical protein
MYLYSFNSISYFFGLIILTDSPNTIFGIGTACGIGTASGIGTTATSSSSSIGEYLSKTIFCSLYLFKHS